MNKESAQAIYQFHKYFNESELKPHNVFVSFFKLAFDSWGYSCSSNINSDKLLVCVLGFWNRFGMFRRDDTDWEQIRRTVDL
jgi:hypothetical protein